MKVIGTFLTVGLLLSLAGCGGKSPEQEKKIQTLTKQVADLENKIDEAENQRRTAQDKVVELEAKIKYLEGKGKAPSTGGVEPKTNGADNSGATNTKPKPKPDTTATTTSPKAPGKKFSLNRPKSVPESEVKIWYYDLNSSQLFISTNNQVAPIKAPSDKDGQFSGVRAYVYSCEACDVADKRVIIFLEKYTDEVKAKIEAHREKFNDENWVVNYAYAEDETLMEGLLRRKLDGKEWVSGSGSEGKSFKAIGENELRLKCQRASKKLTGCAPK